MRLFIRIVAFVITALLLAGCTGESWSWHQKLTIIVATPDGDKSGSSVVEVSWSEVNSVHVYPGGYSGEASVVDLGGGRYLFALLGEQTKYLAFESFNGGPGINEKIFAAMAKFRGVKPVQRNDYPLMVTFDDINDPKSVKKVDPDNLDAAFGCTTSPYAAQIKRLRQFRKIYDEKVKEYNAQLKSMWQEYYSIRKEQIAKVTSEQKKEKITRKLFAELKLR